MAANDPKNSDFAPTEDNLRRIYLARQFKGIGLIAPSMPKREVRPCRLELPGERHNGSTGGTKEKARQGGPGALQMPATASSWVGATQ